MAVQKEEARYALNFAKSVLGEKHWLLRHVANDWLASCWVFLYGGLLSTLLCYLALFFQTENDRQLYVWITSFVNSSMFLIGSAYFVAGSYPRDETWEMLELNDMDEAESGEAEKKRRSIDRDIDVDVDVDVDINRKYLDDEVRNPIMHNGSNE